MGCFTAQSGVDIQRLYIWLIAWRPGHGQLCGWRPRVYVRMPLHEQRQWLRRWRQYSSGQGRLGACSRRLAFGGVLRCSALPPFLLPLQARSKDGQHSKDQARVLQGVSRGMQLWWCLARAPHAHMRVAWHPPARRPPAPWRRPLSRVLRHKHCRCKKHQMMKVTQYKTGKASLYAQGKRRYDR
jgi:hypothetical protein